jgi:S-adenosylmethionine hydrolase
MGRRSKEPTIALLTDFGTRDWFVGTMKGVIAGIAPAASIIDITHEVAPQSVREGAFALVASYRYFPASTVFCVVVDPGVGSEREAIVASDGRYFFVAPNNGVLSFVKRRAARWRAYKIEGERFVLPGASATFHGRDIFAPAAAHLALNRRPQLFGPALRDFVSIRFPEPAIQRGAVRGKIIYIDRFGNVVTNILAGDLRRAGIAEARLITVGRKQIFGIHTTYADVARGKPLAYWGSSEYLEIAVRDGSAARFFAAREGTSVEVR